MVHGRCVGSADDAVEKIAGEAGGYEPQQGHDRRRQKAHEQAAAIGPEIKGVGQFVIGWHSKSFCQFPSVFDKGCVTIDATVCN